METKDPFSDTQFDPKEVRSNIFMQMAKGALLASILFFGPVVFIVVLYFAGTFLPPDSKQAADPTPDSFVMDE
ncbi:MAG: RC-LH1 core complex protein PufX [Pseudomonadota bacterium]